MPEQTLSPPTAAAPARAPRAARWVVARATARRAAASGLLWGTLFGALIAVEATGWHDAFPDAASRQALVASFADNGGIAAVSGEARQIDTLGGFLAWRTFGLLLVLAAVWGLLTSTRLLRGEEDAGRWELLLSGRTARRDATLQGLVGLAAGYAALWLSTAAITVAAGSRPTVGVGVGDALFYATAATAGGAVFLGVGAVTSQLADTRRRANVLGTAVLGVAYALRMVADVVSGWDWLRWASPLGWVENLHPLTGNEAPPLGIIAVVVAACAWVAVRAAGRRDVGAGLWSRPRTPASHLRLLGSQSGLSTRLERGVGVGWVASIGLIALVFAWVARAAGASQMDDSAVTETVTELGGQGTGAAAWIGYEFIYLAGVLCFAAAGQVAAMRTEEADGHLDNLLSRTVSRRDWLLGRLGVALGLIAAAGLAAGLGGWLGLAGTGDVGPGDMLRAGFNVAVPAVLVLGVGTMLLGLAPRLAVPALYAFVLWSVLGSIFGTSLIDSRWVLRTAVLTDLTPVPAAGLDWTAIGVLGALSVVAAWIGVVAFDRRDLAAA